MFKYITVAYVNLFISRRIEVIFGIEKSLQIRCLLTSLKSDKNHICWSFGGIAITGAAHSDLF